MPYLATLTLDYTGQQPNEYTRLLNALCQCGWDYVETSALVFEGEDLDGVRLALEVLARSVESPGMLSSLNVQVVFMGAPRQPPAARNHNRALPNLLRHALPSAQ
ncbi:hypothetical protein [Pseudactinotalea sp.]|uniref:hypothetical protein n=1 Tax=Pseudactinotalea sp. TaxID=1926260 RepID=UPI003B3A9271